MGRRKYAIFNDHYSIIKDGENIECPISNVEVSEERGGGKKLPLLFWWRQPLERKGLRTADKNFLLKDAVSTDSRVEKIQPVRGVVRRSTQANPWGIVAEMVPFGAEFV